MVCCDPISQHSLEPALCWSTCPFWPPTGPTLLLLWPPSSSLASGAKMTTTATIVLDSPASTAHQIKVFLPQNICLFLLECLCIHSKKNVKKINSSRFKRKCAWLCLKITVKFSNRQYSSYGLIDDFTDAARGTMQVNCSNAFTAILHILEETLFTVYVRYCGNII
jgi:hypothetical protein